jgi:hypothetical protein
MGDAPGDDLWIVEAGKPTYEWRPIATVCSCDPDSEDGLPKIGVNEREANACLIAAAPDYADACGLTLHPGENESCGPLSWLRTAIDTLREDAVREAASGDDPDAYWFMLNEVETLHGRLTAASAKARGEQ